MSNVNEDAWTFTGTAAKNKKKKKEGGMKDMNGEDKASGLSWRRRRGGEKDETG